MEIEKCTERAANGSTGFGINLKPAANCVQNTVNADYLARSEGYPALHNSESLKEPLRKAGYIH